MSTAAEANPGFAAVTKVRRQEDYQAAEECRPEWKMVDGKWKKTVKYALAMVKSIAELTAARLLGLARKPHGQRRSPGGQMLALGRLLLATLAVCVVLLPARSEGATMLSGSLDPGSPSNFGDTLNFEYEVAFFSFSLSSTSVITAEMTSYFCPDDCTDLGFLPILTLFEGSVADASSYLGDVSFLDPTISSVEWLTLDPGTYLLAVSVYENYFNPDPAPGAFSYFELFTFDLFTRDVEGPLPTCGTFVQPIGTDVLECRTGVFAGSLTVQGLSVPEPATLSLLAIGAGGILLRRRRSRRSRTGHGSLDS